MSCIQLIQNHKYSHECISVFDIKVPTTTKIKPELHHLINTYCSKCFQLNSFQPTQCCCRTLLSVLIWVHLQANLPLFSISSASSRTSILMALVRRFRLLIMSGKHRAKHFTVSTQINKQLFQHSSDQTNTN